jgi:hypothetical protein
MPRHMLKLLVLAAFAWIAPLGAHQAPSLPWHAKAHGASCPDARAKAAKVADAPSSYDGLPGGGSILRVSAARDLLP